MPARTLLLLQHSGAGALSHAVCGGAEWKHQPPGHNFPEEARTVSIQVSAKLLFPMTVSTSVLEEAALEGHGRPFIPRSREEMGTVLKTLAITG